MKRELTIEGTLALPDGSVVLTGAVDVGGSEAGPFLRVGQRGVASTSGGDITVEITGVGIGDRDIIKPGMEMVLIKVLEGNPRLLKGATVLFE